MRHLIALVTVAGLALAPSCKAKDTDETATDDLTDIEPVEPVAPVEVAPDPMVEDSDMANKMKNCPSAVEGASTVVTMNDGKVEISVTAMGEDKVAMIRERATHLASLNADSAEIQHTGEGEGGGGLGRCPIVYDNVEISTEEIDGGAKLVLTPEEGADAEAIATEVRTRADAMKSGAAMGGHGGATVHGSGMGGGTTGGAAAGGTTAGGSADMGGTAGRGWRGGRWRDRHGRGRRRDQD